MEEHGNITEEIPTPRSPTPKNARIQKNQLAVTTFLRSSAADQRALASENILTTEIAKNAETNPLLFAFSAFFAVESILIRSRLRPLCPRGLSLEPCRLYLPQGDVAHASAMAAVRFWPLIFANVVSAWPMT